MKDYELDEKIGKRLAECMKSAKINGSSFNLKNFLEFLVKLPTM